jgi:hypothetical protein
MSTLLEVTESALALDLEGRALVLKVRCMSLRLLS